MLKQVSLTNFRKHGNLVVDFEPGMTSIRAPNEGGKSTLLEAILYAFFGGKALRTTFADAVTWGHKESELKVVLHFDKYVVTRSSRGAEVTENGGVKVTGQTEVTNFFQDILGVDATTASKLMMSTQGNLRGALEQGAKATSELIEELSNFDLFDRLIEAMQAKLALGPSTPYEEVVALIQSQIDNFLDPFKPDLTTHLKQLEYLEEDLQKSKQIIESSAIKEAEDQLNLMRKEHEEAIRISSMRFSLLKRLSEYNAALQKPIMVRPTDDELLAARSLVESVQREHETRLAWDVFQGIKMPATIWEGSPDSLRSEISTAQGSLSELREERAALTARVTIARSQIVTGECTHCGKDISKLDHVCSRNAELIKEISETEETLLNLERKITVTANLLKNYSFTQVTATQTETELSQALRSLPKSALYISLDSSTYPATPTWVGPSVSSEPSISLQEANRRLQVALNQVDECVRQQNEFAFWKKERENTQAELDKLATLPLGLVTDEEISQASIALEEVKKVVAEAKERVEVHKYLVQGEKEGFENLTKAYEIGIAKKQELESKLATAQYNVSRLQFNNALLKKVRAARPIVSDKLWAIVLASVSQMFSVIRGEKSVVAKGKDGFTVNGQGVQCLSGSTLDILGLALRLALIKTFLPTCPFLLLDEPSAACDADRSAAMMGFIASADFSQVIVVTHDEATEAISNNSIQI